MLFHLLYITLKVNLNIFGEPDCSLKDVGVILSLSNRWRQCTVYATVDVFKTLSLLS